MLAIERFGRAMGRSDGARELGSGKGAASRPGRERTGFPGELKEANGFISRGMDYVNRLTVFR